MSGWLSSFCKTTAQWEKGVRGGGRSQGKQCSAAPPASQARQGGPRGNAPPRYFDHTHYTPAHELGKQRRQPRCARAGQTKQPQERAAPPISQGRATTTAPAPPAAVHGSGGNDLSKRLAVGFGHMSYGTAESIFRPVAPRWCGGGPRRAGLVRGSLRLGHLHRAGPPSVGDGLNGQRPASRWPAQKRENHTPATLGHLEGICRSSHWLGQGLGEVAVGSVRVFRRPAGAAGPAPASRREGRLDLRVTTLQLERIRHTAIW